MIDLYAEPDALHWLPCLEVDGLGFEFLTSFEAEDESDPEALGCPSESEAA